VDRVDLLHLDKSYTPTLGLFLDRLCEFFASRGVELFGVVDSDYPGAGLQDHGGSGDRPGERAHSGLVHARHGMMPALPERRLETEHFAKALPFGPVFETPFIDQSQNGTRSRATVGAQNLLDARLKWSFLDDIALTQHVE